MESVKTRLRIYLVLGTSAGILQILEPPETALQIKIILSEPSGEFMIFICEFSSFRRFLVFTDSEAVSDTDNSTAGYK